MKKYSYANSKKILDHLNRVNAVMRDSMMENINVNLETIRKETNKAVYEWAEKNNLSIYEVCLHTEPKLEYEFKDVGFPVTPMRENFFKITLEPVELELEKGPGYWKDKYLRLKEKIIDLVENDKP